MFFLASTISEIHVNISITVNTVGRISLCDGGKLVQSEGCNYFFIISFVLESK